MAIQLSDNYQAKAERLAVLPSTDLPPITEVNLTREQVETIGRELEELRARIMADVGESDREYLYKIIRTQRGLEIGGRP